MAHALGHELTDKQERFLREYLVDHNAKQAAIRTGYAPKAAEVQGSVLLSKPKVKARLAELAQLQAARLDLTADTVLSELLLLAKVDPKDLVDARGRPLPMHKIPEAVRRAISSVEVTKEGTKYRLWSKTTSLELLGRHLKLFLDRFEITDGGLAQALDEARERRLKAQKRRGR